MGDKEIISTFGIVVSLIFIIIGLTYNILFLTLFGYMFMLIFSVIYGLFHNSSKHISSTKEYADIKYPHLTKKNNLLQLSNLRSIASLELPVSPIPKRNYTAKNVMSFVSKNSEWQDYDFQNKLDIAHEKKGTIDDENLCMYT